MNPSGIGAARVGVPGALALLVMLATHVAAAEPRDLDAPSVQHGAPAAPFILAEHRNAPPLPSYPEPRVRAWQVGLLRADRLQHLGLSFTLGVMSGVTSESPAAAAGAAFGIGLAKELWDTRHGDFDLVDLLADACGAAGATATTITLTK